MRIARVGVVGATDAAASFAASIAAAGIPVVRSPADRGPAGAGESLAGFGEVDLAIVAVDGDADDPAALLAELDASTPGRAILAPLSASAPVSELAVATLKPERVVGLHLPYPGADSRLLEIHRGAATAPATLASVFAFAQAVRFSPIVCGEVGGGVVDRIRAAARRERDAGGDGSIERLRLAALAEACVLVGEGGCTVREVDAAIAAARDERLPAPFLAADRVGLEVVRDRLEALRVEGGERFAPPLLRRLVSQGRLGRQSGQGFYPVPRPDAGPQSDTVKLETRGEIAILWLDNEPVNAISIDVVEALARAWEAARAAGARAVVIASSSPRVFSAGGDLKAFDGLDEASGRQLIDRVHEVFGSFWTEGTPTVAAINGLALGGGCELGMACDFRLAAQSAYFSLPEATLGTAPSFGATVRLPRLIGEARALEMIALGRVALAEEAQAIGLVNAVVPDHDLFDEALALAQELAAQPPLAIAQMKRALRKGDAGEEVAAEKAGFAALVASEDAREGLAAFLERRDPVWRGR